MCLMITNPSTQQESSIVSDHDFAQVMLNEATGQKSLQASISFQPGDIICQFGPDSILDHPTYLTVQVADDKHITLSPEFLQYINHSCDPSVFFDTTSFELIC